MTLIKTCDGCHKTKNEVGPLEDIIYLDDICDDIDLCRGCILKFINLLRKENGIPEVESFRKLEEG